MDRPGATPSLGSRIRFALAPEPAPVLVRSGIAVLVDIVVVYACVRTALILAGYPEDALTHAVLPAVFGGMLAFLGSLGGTLRSGLGRAVLLSAVSLPLTLAAIACRQWPLAAGPSLAAMAVLAGLLAWRGEPLATLGSLLLYIYFVPFVFGAGTGVPVRFLLLGFGVMTVCTLSLRALVAQVPKHRAPVRVAATDETASTVLPSGRFALLPQPQLGRLHRTTTRSALALGVGAAIVSATADHTAVWVLMTLIALVPPGLPLTIDRVLQRLVGTALAMLLLTAVDALVPPGPWRLLALAPGIVVTIAFIRRSYTLSVLGISTVAVLAYAQVSAPLGEALLWRGLATLVGAVIAIAVTLLIPVGARPQPVWARH